MKLELRWSSLSSGSSWCIIDDEGRQYPFGDGEDSRLFAEGVVKRGTLRGFGYTDSYDLDAPPNQISFRERYRKAADAIIKTLTDHGVDIAWDMEWSHEELREEWARLIREAIEGHSV